MDSNPGRSAAILRHLPGHRPRSLSIRKDGSKSLSSETFYDSLLTACVLAVGRTSPLESSEGFPILTLNVFLIIDARDLELMVVC